MTSPLREGRATFCLAGRASPGNRGGRRHFRQRRSRNLVGSCSTPSAVPPPRHPHTGMTRPAGRVVTATIPGHQLTCPRWDGSCKSTRLGCRIQQGGHEGVAERRDRTGGDQPLSVGRSLFSPGDGGAGGSTVTPTRSFLQRVQRVTVAPVATGAAYGPVASAAGPSAFGLRSTAMSANLSEAPTLSATMSRVSRV